MISISTMPTSTEPNCTPPRGVSNGAPVEDDATFWEGVAQSRWGRYVTAIEQEAVRAAAAAFEAPGAGLEVGCDGGRWTRLLCDRGWRMTATDINPRSLELCRQRNPSVSCILVDSHDRHLPADTGSMDLLLCLEMPEIDSDWFLPEARRVLARGGILVGVHMNRCSWRGELSYRKAQLVGGKAYYRSAYPAFRRFVERCGLELLSQRGCCWPPFKRDSDSSWISLVTTLERWTGLQRVTALSPWIVFTAVRQ
jgi:SAM-dependent methyltransferase